MLAIARALAKRATCQKLAVGCVLVDRYNRIVGTGYNGTPMGMVHCTDVPCEGADAPAGSDLCLAVHAEQNALLSCHDPMKIATCYVTHKPCLRCVKELLNTSCGRIVFGSAWPPSQRAGEFWEGAGKLWEHYGA